MRNYRVFALTSLTPVMGLAALAAATPIVAKPMTAMKSNASIALLDKSMAQGKPLYKANCAMCHGPEGKGLVGPGLRQNLKNTRGVVRVIISGRAGMPPLGATLSNGEIAVLVTYIRNSWGNKFGVTTKEEVASHRPVAAP